MDSHVDKSGGSVEKGRTAQKAQEGELWGSGAVVRQRQEVVCSTGWSITYQDERIRKAGTKAKNDGGKCVSLLNFGFT